MRTTERNEEIDKMVCALSTLPRECSADILPILAILQLAAVDEMKRLEAVEAGRG